MFKLLSAVVAFALVAGHSSAAVSVSPAARQAHSAAAHALHKAHLESALKHIQTAEADAKAGNKAAAEKATAAAVQQLKQAQGHHANNPALHAAHHTHVQQALADLTAAEALLKGTGKAGKAAKAKKAAKTGTAETELAKAETQVKAALAGKPGVAAAGKAKKVK